VKTTPIQRNSQQRGFFKGTADIGRRWKQSNFLSGRLLSGKKARGVGGIGKKGSLHTEVR